MVIWLHKKCYNIKIEDIMITEKEITEVLKNELQWLPYVYAFWIEGSFAMGYADEYFVTYLKAYAAGCC